jgi:hypothetical protein
VKPKYRPLSPQLRADHIAALDRLGQGVVNLSAPPLHWRRFVVVSVVARPLGAGPFKPPRVASRG